MKHLTIIAAVVVAGVTQGANAVQKHDPQFNTPLVFDWSAYQTPRNLVAMVRSQNGSPKAKPDLYVLHNTGGAVNRNLVREIAAQTGSPKSKQDVCVIRPATSQTFAIAPLK